MQLAYQVLRGNEVEVARLKAIEKVSGLLGVLASLAPELVEMTTKVNEVAANSGELAKVSRLEFVNDEEAAELVRPELARIEQLVECAGLEVLTHEEVTKVAFELVGPEGVYEQVRREVSRIKGVVEIPVREVTMVNGTIESRPTVKSGASLKAGAAVKGGHAIEYEVSSRVEGESALKSGVRGWAIVIPAVLVVPAIGKVTGLEVPGWRLVVEIAGWRFEIVISLVRLRSVGGREVPTMWRRLVERAVDACVIPAIRGRLVVPTVRGWIISPAVRGWIVRPAVRGRIVRPAVRGRIVRTTARGRIVRTTVRGWAIVRGRCVTARSGVATVAIGEGQVYRMAVAVGAKQAHNCDNRRKYHHGLK